MGLLKAEYERANMTSHLGGPHNLGDPADRSLRETEAEIVVMNLVRDRARKEKCTDSWTEFGNCVEKEGSLMMAFKCREQNDQVKECMGKWFNDVDFQRECMDIYLDRRAKYRATGVPHKDAIYKRK